MVSTRRLLAFGVSPMVVGQCWNHNCHVKRFAHQSASAAARSRLRCLETMIASRQASLPSRSADSSDWASKPFGGGAGISTPSEEQ